MRIRAAVLSVVIALLLLSRVLSFDLVDRTVSIYVFQVSGKIQPLLADNASESKQEFHMIFNTIRIAFGDVVFFSVVIIITCCLGFRRREDFGVHDFDELLWCSTVVVFAHGLVFIISIFNAVITHFVGHSLRGQGLFHVLIGLVLIMRLMKTFGFDFSSKGHVWGEKKFLNKITTFFIACFGIMTGLLGSAIAPPIPFNAVYFLYILRFSLFGPVVEELIFRGLLYTALERWGGTIIAYLISSLLFALYHNRDFSETLFVFGFGIVYAWLRHRQGSVFAPIALHSACNLMVRPCM